MYVSIDHTDGRGRDGARLEAHRRYIDMQYTIDGDEEIGWMPVGEVRRAVGAVQRDEGRRRSSPARPTSWFYVPPGRFAISFRTTRTRPSGGAAPSKKPSSR